MGFMTHGLGRIYLYLLVIVAGFTTLGVELSAARLLDPWFGNSLLVWAGLIGLILLYLAIGYWLGGRIADRWPQPVVLLGIMAVAAAAVGLIPTLARPVLKLAADGLAGFDAVVLAGSLAAVLALFAVPVILLGCVSPYAIRLSLPDVASSGRTSGRIYAASTAGSIAGSFLPVLFLIPTIGTRATFAVLAAALLVDGHPGLHRHPATLGCPHLDTRARVHPLAGLATGRAGQAIGRPDLRDRIGPQLHPGD